MKTDEKKSFLSFSFLSSSGLMNTTQPTKESSQTPPGQLNSYHQFQPIQHQPPTLSFISKASALEAGKINATSTHFELDQQPNCVSSLITMSCRGRAEAFARSLQSRLRTLGSQVKCFLLRDFNEISHHFLFPSRTIRTSTLSTHPTPHGSTPTTTIQMQPQSQSYSLVWAPPSPPKRPILTSTLTWSRSRRVRPSTSANIHD